MRTRLSILLAMAFTIMIASCASTPKNGQDTSKDNIREQGVSEYAIAYNLASNARNLAIEAGAESYASDLLNYADKIFNKIKDDGTSASINKLKNSEASYSAIELYVLALKAKERIDSNNWVSYDQASYDDGIRALEGFQARYLGSTDFQESYAQAKYAKTCFDRVIFKVFRTLAKAERDKALEAKRLADGVKAAVASKDSYKKACDDFKEGDSSYARQRGEDAYNSYIEACKEFTSLYEKVSVMRDAASKAMEEARTKVQESANYAEVADTTAPLQGEEIQGIEKEDAKLLEDDVYQSPESQEIELPEDLPETEAQDTSVVTE